VHDPPVLILDEPTVGLDPTQIQEIRGLIRDLAAPKGGEAKHTVILSTHILPEVEAICRRVILIHQGRKVLDAPLAELTADGTRLEVIFARETARDASASAGEGAA
jgi:ABC-2 type transport system ATP-binding protein